LEVYHISKEERKTRKRKKKAFDQAADCGVKVLAIFFDTLKMNLNKSKNIDKPAGLDLVLHIETGTYLCCHFLFFRIY